MPAWPARPLRHRIGIVMKTDRASLIAHPRCSSSSCTDRPTDTPWQKGSTHFWQTINKQAGQKKAKKEGSRPNIGTRSGRRFRFMTQLSEEEEKEKGGISCMRILFFFPHAESAFGKWEYYFNFAPRHRRKGKQHARKRENTHLKRTDG